MSLVIITKVVDSSGVILKYEDDKGNILAKLEEDKVFNSTQLIITEKGIEFGFILVNNKLMLRGRFKRETKK